MDAKHHPEEEPRAPQAVLWVLIALLSAALIGYGLWAHHIVPDVERSWDFGALPQTPAESVYSSAAPDPDAGTPRQMEPLPEARPLQPDRGEGP